MKNVQLIGVSALLSMAVACSSQSGPSNGTVGGQPSPSLAQPDQSAPGCTALPQPVGTANPATVYCTELGYSLNGEQCAFPDGTSCEQWSFYRGECGGTHSFCNLHGGTVANKTEDMGTWTASYALCTLPSGKQCQEDAFAQSCTCDQPAPSGPAQLDAGPAPDCTALPQPVGTANPATVYCTDLGYSLNGEQCAFPDGTSCEQWSFYRGECGGTHSFCNLHGGTVTNKTEDMGTWTASYALCTLPSGKQCEDDAFAHTCTCE